MAGVTGLEPAASGVTGRRSNRLSYTPVRAREAATCTAPLTAKSTKRPGRPVTPSDRTAAEQGTRPPNGGR
jgi:hypothetical protein